MGRGVRTQMAGIRAFAVNALALTHTKLLLIPGALRREHAYVKDSNGRFTEDLSEKLSKQ